jgi:hypothetical protein
MKTGIMNTIPVLPTSEIRRDIAWHKEKMGPEVYFSDSMYGNSMQTTISYSLFHINDVQYKSYWETET